MAFCILKGCEVLAPSHFLGHSFVGQRGQHLSLLSYFSRETPWTISWNWLDSGIGQVSKKKKKIPFQIRNQTPSLLADRPVHLPLHQQSEKKKKMISKITIQFAVSDFQETVSFIIIIIIIFYKS